MMHTKVLTAAPAVAATLSSAVPSHAITVTNLAVFNTGVDASGNPLACGTIDPHYTLIDSLEVVLNCREAFVTDNRFPTGARAPNTSVSKWISPPPRSDAANN